MTREDILGLPFYPHECGSMIECVTKQDALKAMDEFAKQESIEFAHFSDGYIAIRGDKQWLMKDAPFTKYTDNELYKKYLQSKQQP